MCVRWRAPSRSHCSARGARVYDVTSEPSNRRYSHSSAWLIRARGQWLGLARFLWHREKLLGLMSVQWNKQVMRKSELWTCAWTLVDFHSFLCILLIKKAHNKKRKNYNFLRPSIRLILSNQLKWWTRFIKRLLWMNTQYCIITGVQQYIL